MNNGGEDYLDQLLNAVKDTEPNPHIEIGMSGRKGEEKKKSRRKSRERKSEEAFLDDFEKELESFDAERFMSDFDLDLDSELSGAEKEDMPEWKEEPSSFSFDGLDAAMNEPEDEADSESIKEETAEKSFAEESFTEESFAEESLEEESLVEESSVVEEPVEEETIAEEFIDENPEENDAEQEMDSGEEISSGEAAEDSGDSSDGDDDILALLDGLGDDEDLSDIGDMLKKDENHEAIEGGDITPESVADSLSDIGFEIAPTDLEELEGLKEVSKGTASGTETSEGQQGKKKGFLTKLKELFFGPDEEEQNTGIEPITKDELVGISDENLDILKSLEGTGKAAAEEDPKAKKKAEKEAKKKEAADKKAEKAKAKEAAKKAKEAAKKAKPKKEKKPKVKDNTPPLPKVPVLLVIVMCATIVGFILFASKGLHYRQSMANSQDCYVVGDYIGAYSYVQEISLDEEDAEYGEKVKTLACMQDLYNSYKSLKKAKRDELALDCLIRLVGHYDVNLEQAKALEYEPELAIYKVKAEKILKKHYHVSYDEAVKLYKIRSRRKYSVLLVTILKEAGF